MLREASDRRLAATPLFDMTGITPDTSRNRSRAPRRTPRRRRFIL
jgi:hypothetical protein